MPSKQHAAPIGRREWSCDMRVYSFPHETCPQELLLLRWFSLTSNNNNIRNYSKICVRMQPLPASFPICCFPITSMQPQHKSFPPKTIKQMQKGADSILTCRLPYSHVSIVFKYPANMANSSALSPVSAQAVSFPPAAQNLSIAHSISSSP